MRRLDGKRYDDSKKMKRAEAQRGGIAHTHPSIQTYSEQEEVVRRRVAEHPAWITTLRRGRRQHQVSERDPGGLLRN